MKMTFQPKKRQSVSCQKSKGKSKIICLILQGVPVACLMGYFVMNGPQAIVAFSFLKFG